MLREPVVAGQFYPGTAEGLMHQIESMVNKKAKKEKAKGIVSPHAGYIYSGPVAGALYSHVELPDTIIILGPNHTGAGSTFSLYAKGKWKTPLGEVEIDEKLAHELLKSSDLIKEDERAHAYEHSLEVQIPFIQYFKKDFKIVPLVLSSSTPDDYNQLGRALAASVKKENKEALIVASSDMTHYEPHEQAKKKDRLAIDAVLKLDHKKLLETVQEYDISMCGCVPAAVMLIAAKGLGAKSAELIKYQTSGDTSGDYSAVVGYAGIMVK